MHANPTRKIRKLQEQFFHNCINSTQTIDEVLDDLGLPPETLAGWLMQPAFRVRLHGMRRYLRRARDIQLEMGALHASAVLLRTATDTAIKKTEPLARSACVDLIRLSRDSRARMFANNPTADDETKRRALYHPGVPEEEARELIEALARQDGLTSTPSPSGRGPG